MIYPLLNALSQTPGDVNADGFINHGDMLLIKDYIMDRIVLEEDARTSADTNQDNKVDVGDMLTIDIHTTFSIPMVYVPSGTFTMGARDDGDDLTYRYSDELPRHEVTLSAYYIGKYEITNGQYCAVLNWAKGMGYLENSWGGSYTEGSVYKNGVNLLEISSSYCQITYRGGAFTWKTRVTYSMETHPVVMVSWYGSVVYCNWLSEKEGKTPAYNLSTWELVNKTGGGYSLPTEAEWERAAAWDGSKHWIYGYSSDNGNNMSGNVWEWCHDWYSSTYYNGGAMIDPNGPASGSHRVLRGGPWSNWAVFCRTAFRFYSYSPSSTFNDSGFRAVLRSPAR